MLERFPLLKSQRVGLGDNGHDVDNFAELLHDDNVNRTQGVTRRIYEEQGTMDAGVLNIAVAFCRELLAEIGTMLILRIRQPIALQNLTGVS